jgi:hypothetical protein
MIEGAVRNAAHAHPEVRVPERFARSVAKRAAGTLTANWPDVLAAPRAVAELSDMSGSQVGIASANRFYCRKPARGAASPTEGRAPLRFLHGRIGRMAGDARRSGDIARHAALVDVLRIVAELMTAGVRR